MKNKPTLTWVAGLCLTLLTVSCNDHRLVPSGQRFRLSSVSSGNSQEQNRVDYMYNNSNKLQNSTTRFESRGAVSQTTTQFKYDSQGRLTTTEEMSTPSGSSRRVTFGYDATGNLTSAKTESFSPFSSVPVSITQQTFSYGSGKYPTKVTSDSGAITYTYTNENITQATSLSTVESFTYDDKPNPYYGLVGIGIGPSIFSKNNVISAGKTYSYDTNGLLTLIFTPGEPAQGGPTSVVYRYEFY